MGQADQGGQYGGMRVLVIDDNHDAASALALLVELWGYDVRVGHDGPHALAAFEQFRPQAILLDIGLPGMSGYEAARRMRRMESSEGRDRALLVAITGYGSADDMAQAWDAGFDHHMLKPSDPLFLERLLLGHATGALHGASAANAAADTANPADAPVVEQDDTSGRRTEVNGDSTCQRM